MELDVNGILLNQRYVVEKRLGKGSYAEIYTAVDRFAASDSPYYRVVIKALNPYLQEDVDEALLRTLVENFEIESKVLDIVRHPNIVSRLGHGTEIDRNKRRFHYLILEYLPGGDLSKICRPNGLPLRQVIYYLEQVCAGLMKAHQNGVIHRDIKPQNLLLTADRKIVKIADFGVARFVELTTPVTRVGTNVYAPPEHNPLNQPDFSNQVTPAADIYSLAKTAYVLLTGKTPREFISRPITSLPEGFSRDVANLRFLAILEKATKDDPSERYQSVEEFWYEFARLDETRKGYIANLLPNQRISAGYTDVLPEVASFQQSLHDFDQNRSWEDNNQVIFQNHRTAKTNSFYRKPLKIFAFLIIFAIALFATQLYLKTNFPVSDSRRNVVTEGVATTDINIRPSPGTKEAPVGLVPRGSRVKILRKQDGWYEVNVIEYSRPKRDKNDADRGWINGKYVEIRSNN